MSPDVGAKDEVLAQVRREETAGIRIRAGRAGEFAWRKGDPESRKSERMGGTQNVMSPDVGAKDEVLAQGKTGRNGGNKGVFFGGCMSERRFWKITVQKRR